MSFNPVGPDRADVVETAGVFTTITVGTSAVELKVGGSALANRQIAHFQPKDKGVFWGYSSGVTTANGTEVFKDQFIAIGAGPAVTIFLIGDAAGKDVRIGEIS